MIPCWDSSADSPACRYPELSQQSWHIRQSPSAQIDSQPKLKQDSELYEETAFLDDDGVVTEANECPHFVVTGIIDDTLMPSSTGEELMNLVFTFGYLLEKDCIDLEAFVDALGQDPELKVYADEDIFFPGIEENHPL